MRKFSVVRLVAVVAAVTLLLGACSNDKKVGGEVGADANGDIGGFDPNALDPTTTTTAAPTSTTAAPTGNSSTTAKPTTTVAPKESTTTTAKPAIEVTINGDNSGKSQFEPSLVSVFERGIIVFRNNDTVPRSVESDKPGLFETGEIPPGGTKELKANFGSGRFNYHDGTRPYAVGSISVSKRP